MLMAENSGTGTRVVRRRFRIESALSGIAGVLAIVTVISREWIEWLTGFDPDGGDGSLEWALVAVLVVISISAGKLAHLEWNRAHPATDAE